ncbi:hypothetical protein [Nannocystis pusilla]|uniref:Uncharacterized protein n=1 Tax=Nannocystis pusilla TaxID=889268 RepID=A0ABS7TUH7_9BACT|nr:hypothetical protein [Nannocystis pusilla]MBZ5711900.1 hypothetical protein [Nannocystis pusilla]
MALAGLLVVFASPPAVPRVELTWQAPAACPDAGAVHERLRALAPEPPAGPVVRAEADVARRGAGAGWRLRLALRGPGLDDRRVIEARDCRVLADVTALLIALAIAPEEVAGRAVPAASGPGAPDASVRAGAPPPGVPAPPATATDASVRESEPPGVVPEPSLDATTRANAPNPGVPPVPEGRASPPTGLVVVPPVDDAALDPSEPRESELAPDPAAPPRARAPVRAAVRLGAGGEVGAIPAWSPAGGLAVAVFRGAWRVELAGTYAARALTYPEPAAVGGRMLVAAGALRGCGVPRWRRLEFPICAGVELGYVRAVARGVTDPQPASDLWIAAQLSPGLAWVPRRFLAVTLGVDVLVGLRRPGFHVTSLGELARGERVGLRPMAGLELRFP